MAPISHSYRNVKLAYVRHDGTYVFKADLDPEWTIGRVVHGGYMLSIGLCAANLHQRAHKGAPPDPAHITAYYLRPSALGPAEIEVKAVKKGRDWWNVDVQIRQGKTVKVVAHLMYSTLKDVHAPLDPGEIAEYSPDCPLRTPPSKCPETPAYSNFNWKDRMRWADDPEINARRKKLIADKEHNARVDYATWHTLTSPDDAVYGSPEILMYLCDMFRNLPELLDLADESHWYPTLVISIQFISKITSSASSFASHTVGLFSEGSFLSTPSGRHDVGLEVWTAPKPEDEGPGWRKNQRALASVKQMALVVSMDRNRHDHGDKPQAKL